MLTSKLARFALLSACLGFCPSALADDFKPHSERINNDHGNLNWESIARLSQNGNYDYVKTLSNHSTTYNCSVEWKSGKEAIKTTLRKATDEKTPYSHSNYSSMAVAPREKTGKLTYNGGKESGNAEKDVKSWSCLDKESCDDQPKEIFNVLKLGFKLPDSGEEVSEIIVEIKSTESSGKGYLQEIKILSSKPEVIKQCKFLITNDNNVDESKMTIMGDLSFDKSTSLFYVSEKSDVHQLSTKGPFANDGAIKEIKEKGYSCKIQFKTDATTITTQKFAIFDKNVKYIKDGDLAHMTFKTFGMQSK